MLNVVCGPDVSFLAFDQVKFLPAVAPFAFPTLTSIVIPKCRVSNSASQFFPFNQVSSSSIDLDIHGSLSYTRTTQLTTPLFFLPSIIKRLRLLTFAGSQQSLYEDLAAAIPKMVSLCRVIVAHPPHGRSASAFAAILNHLPSLLEILNIPSNPYSINAVTIYNLFTDALSKVTTALSNLRLLVLPVITTGVSIGRSLLALVQHNLTVLDKPATCAQLLTTLRLEIRCVLVLVNPHRA